MNSFQLNLTKQLIELVASPGLGEVVLEIKKGPTEPTVEIRLVEKEVAFWIYEDGAQILGPVTDRRFEKQDYKDLTSLAEDFSDNVARYASALVSGQDV